MRQALTQPRSPACRVVRHWAACRHAYPEPPAAHQAPTAGPAWRRLRQDCAAGGQASERHPRGAQAPQTLGVLRARGVHHGDGAVPAGRTPDQCDRRGQPGRPQADGGCARPAARASAAVPARQPSQLSPPPLLMQRSACRSSPHLCLTRPPHQLALPRSAPAAPPRPACLQVSSTAKLQVGAFIVLVMDDKKGALTKHL
jgi:hypothetical protein